MGGNLEALKENRIIKSGSFFNERVKIIISYPLGNNQIKLISEGLESHQTHHRIITEEQASLIELEPEKETYAGDPAKFKIGVEAIRLGIAYEYDPYFSLSIARVDPLPHQLEAVYDYFVKLPRIRFLLADDPGAGKTIMAGLLIKELKIRGLIKRTLVVAPANLTFQWQRELKDKFRENFEIVNSASLRTNYGINPWQDKNQVITSVSWVSVIQDANESLLRSNWDLIIVDEAHKMSAYSTDKKTLAYQLGEHLSEMTDHYLLMTATPHKGVPENFRLFLQLLDKDVYADITSLDEAIKRKSAPFYLRRVKEALITFPDPDTGKPKAIFTKRIVRTIDFQISDAELDFYELLTDYVEQQSAKAAQTDTARGRALGFTMAMLQRRFASSVFAVRRSLERMRDKRQTILEDPEGYRKKQIIDKMPEDFEDLTNEEQQEILDELENIVASINPADLQEEIASLSILIKKAQELEKLEVESKLTKLKEVITTNGIFNDRKMKLLLFTEHKDTLEYLVGKLRDWGLTVTQIHGGMKIGDRDMTGSRLYAEREFKEDCQILVATEAAGEGINLQFCWFMINYDIPWNPMRLEQRMGRIHRYGQEKNCLIYNFVSTNTREGRVLGKLLERLSQIENDIDPDRTGKVFNVLGDVFPSNQLEKMLREMYAKNLSEDLIKERIIEQVDAKRFESITNSALESLAKKELNLSAIMGKAAEAKERRLVPEVIEKFFVKAAPEVGILPKENPNPGHIFRIGKVPRSLKVIGEELEPLFGKLGGEYKNIIFDKDILKIDPTLEWVTPGHPLFEAVRKDVLEKVAEHLRMGAIFYDIDRKEPAQLDIFEAAISDGNNNTLSKRLFVIETSMNGTIEVRQPTIFLDLQPPYQQVKEPITQKALVKTEIAEQELIQRALLPFLEEVKAQRKKEIEIIQTHIDISLRALIQRQNLKMLDLLAQQQSGENSPLIAANLKTAQDRFEELNCRYEKRVNELNKEKNCTISRISLVGKAWVLPNPDRERPDIKPFVKDEKIEKTAILEAIRYEEARGFKVESVEKDNRGFDLISRKYHPEDPATAIEIRFIEVKGRADIGEIALTPNEYDTAKRLKKDYWLYVVYNCSSTPRLIAKQDPSTLNWEMIEKVVHYKVGPEIIENNARGS